MGWGEVAKLLSSHREAVVLQQCARCDHPVRSAALVDSSSSSNQPLLTMAPSAAQLLMSHAHHPTIVTDTTTKHDIYPE